MDLIGAVAVAVVGLCGLCIVAASGRLPDALASLRRRE